MILLKFILSDLDFLNLKQEELIILCLVIHLSGSFIKYISKKVDLLYLLALDFKFCIFIVNKSAKY